MAMIGSAETIRTVKKDIQKIINDIEKISNGIAKGVSSTPDWNDNKAMQFNILMGRISKLTKQPVETLNAALPKLEKLATSIDNYNRTGFGGGS